MAEVHRVVSNLPPGVGLGRYLQAKCVQEQHGAMAALDVAKAWRTTPQVLACLEAELQFKAAVAPMTTSDATAAGPLVQYGVSGEYLPLERGSSVVGQLLAAKARRVPFHTRTARETGAGTGGAWLGEGSATPVAATAFDAITQECYRASKIVVLPTQRAPSRRR